MTPEQRRLFERIMLGERLRPLILTMGIGGLIVFALAAAVALFAGYSLAGRHVCETVRATVTDTRSWPNGHFRGYEQSVEDTQGRQFVLQAGGGVLEVGDQVELTLVCNRLGDPLIYQYAWQEIEVGVGG